MEEYKDIIGKYTKPVDTPENKIVVTEERFCFEEPIVFKLKEHFFSITDDDYTIKDLNGVKYFHCEGKLFSFRDRKVLTDLYNQPILCILSKFISLRGKMNIYEGKDDKKALLKIKPKSPIFNKKLIVHFFNKETGKDEILEMHCDFFAFNCEIYYGKKKEGAPMIVRITKKIDVKSVLTSEENYYVEVAAGVDAAAIISLAICFDENRNDNSTTGNIISDIVDIFI